MFDFIKRLMINGCVYLAFFTQVCEGNNSTSSLGFCEIWGYLKQQEEAFFPSNSPITDVAYFCAQLDEEGRVLSVPDVDKLPPACKGLRIHLVVGSFHNKWLMYWVLKKDLKARDVLVKDIVKASEKYHGVQIDFESLREQEKEPYIDFLKKLKARLPKGKMLSVAIPARTRDRQDAFDYEQIGKIVDRVIVMAYDEHWSGGTAGAIASGSWCERVASYALEKIPTTKLVMALPFYGRVWQTSEVACSLKYCNVLRLWEKHKAQAPIVRTGDSVPSFSFEEKVKATCYFEDLQSLEFKLKLYQGKNVDKVAFWRLSQEPVKIWQMLKTVPSKK